MELYLMKGRNVNETTDNFFTSLLLASKLLAKKITLVETIRSNNKQLSKFPKKDKMSRYII